MCSYYIVTKYINTITTQKMNTKYGDMKLEKNSLKIHMYQSLLIWYVMRAFCVNKTHRRSN